MNVLAPFCVCKVLVIIEQMYFVVRVLFHLLVVLHALENHLTKTIKVGDIRHLAIVKLVHQHAGLDRAVYLEGDSISIATLPKILDNIPQSTVSRHT